MMWLKNKLVRNILISIVSLGLLGGVYAAIMMIPEKTEQPETELITPDGRTALFDFQQKDVKEIRIINGENSYTLESTVIDLKIKNNDGSYTTQKHDTWKVKEYDYIDFQRIKLENAAIDFMNIYSVTTVENPEALSAYGLDGKEKYIEAVLNDGGVKRLFIGNEVTGSSETFVMTEDGKVHTVNSTTATALLQDINSYRSKDLVQVDTSSVEYMKVAKDGSTLVELRRKNEDEKNKFSALSSYVMTSPRYEAVSVDTLSKVLESVSNISVKQFVEDRPQNLARYGLDNPSVVFEITDGAGSYKIKYGLIPESRNEVYAMLDGRDYVFTQDLAMFAALVNIKPLDMLSGYIQLVDITTVNNIEIEGDGKKHVMKIEGSEDDMSFFIDDIFAAESAFKNTYQHVIGITASNFAERQPTGAADYTFKFNYRDGRTMTVEFVSYDDRNYAAKKDGNAEFIVLKKNVSSIMEALDKLADSPKDPEVNKQF